MGGKGEFKADFFKFKGEVGEFEEKRELVVGWELVFEDKPFDCLAICLEIKSFFFLLKIILMGKIHFFYLNRKFLFSGM